MGQTYSSDFSQNSLLDLIVIKGGASSLTYLPLTEGKRSVLVVEKGKRSKHRFKQCVPKSGFR